MTWQQTKMKRRNTDILWTKYIKLRDKGICQYNFKCFRNEGSDVSHFHGRRKESVRFDDENSDLACRVCHNFVHTAEGARRLEEWKREQLGDRRFNLLLLRANLPEKRDDYLTKLRIQELLKKYRN